MSEKKYFSEINICRGIAVLLVLLGHSFPDAQTGIEYVGVKWVFDFLYAFHMGLFFILSGFVSAKKIYEADSPVSVEVLKKVKRLLIPYFVYSVITLFLKVFFESYANNPFSLSEFWQILLGKNPNGGLWYLWTLFVMSVFLYLLAKAIRPCSEKTKTGILLGVGTVTYILYLVFPSMFLTRVFTYTIFYIFGVILGRYYEYFGEKFFRPVLAVILLALVFVIKCPMLDWSVTYLITGVMGSYALLTFSVLINRNSKSKGFQILDVIGSYSYDIYMISYFVQVPIRVVCWRILGFNYWITVACMFVFGLVVPYFVSKYIIRRVPVFRKLFIGDWR